MFSRVLVANRGEIAVRVIRALHELDVEAVAVYSTADENALHVRLADRAVRIGPAPAAQSYLSIPAIVAAANTTGCEAVHPGYGFLSESADFARLVSAAGLTWVGPTPDSMELMASKVRAKELMATAGVPVLPELSPAAVTEADLPLIVKASAGGGGRGMRVVRTLGALDDAVQHASVEAESAFGDGAVFCERYLEHGRHVEVQLLGDTHGTVVVLGDRDCSVQRRHQKVLEEAPAPHLSDDVRAELHRAARAAGEAVGYVGAGTVEFLVEGDRVVAASGGNPPGVLFLEMNTRLQVEHPVTELVTGLDLVELQLLVAEGGQVPQPPVSTGHAVEARLYAEDPAHDWQPQSGRLTRFEVDHDVAFGPLAGPGVRLDTGFGSGDEVGTHYDAMLAKVVARAPTREAALRRLAAALARARIHGLRTNRELLVEVLRNDDFVAGGVGTDFLANAPLQQLDSHPLGGSPVQQGLLLFAAAVATAEAAAAHRPVQRGVPTGWRNVVSAPQVTTFELDGTEVRVGWLGDRGGYRFVDLYDEVHSAQVSGVERGAGLVRVPVQHEGLTQTFDVYVEGDRVDVESSLGHVSLVRRPRFVDPADQVAGGSLLAPMPGTVVRVDVEPGTRVTAGQPVLVLEAMKMQHTITAPHDGEVDGLAVGVGSHVAAGAVLAVVRIPTHEGETA
jgi:propionyl-CoA carboxylase alpha chain